jgi:hypothetical protein
LIQQVRKSLPAVEVEHTLVKQPWIATWKAQCRAKIRRCDGAVVLVSKKTAQAEGVPWELECANEAGLPVLAVHIDKYDQGRLPNGVSCRVVDWDLTSIVAFVRSLDQSSAATA